MHQQTSRGAIEHLHREEALIDKEGHVTGPEGVVVMPGTHKEAADEIKQVGAEGAPADAKLGPRALRMAMLGGWLVLAGVSVAAGLTLGWPVGFAMLAIGTLFFFFNPVMLATSVRAKEREEALAHHYHVMPHDESHARHA